MPIDRRTILASGLLTAGLAANAHAAGAKEAPGNLKPSRARLKPDARRDQTAEFQSALDACAAAGEALQLPAGKFRLGHLRLPSGAMIVGSGPSTVLEFTGAAAAFITARGASDIAIERLVIDGDGLAIDASVATGLIDLQDCAGVRISCIEVRRGLLNGIALRGVAGRIVETRVAEVSQAGILSLDAAGLEIAHCEISDCGNNGIQVWRDEIGEDGTLVCANRISRIAAKAGGSGENGNGINVFRAGSVLVSGNRITDCAYSAVRGNAASNMQVIANSCARLGEVALYSEFGFEGALIANNVVDGAAAGVAVANFREGGRIAVVQGNIIRNLFRREQEPVDKRGDGISVEADAVVSGNVVENAPSVGIGVGWGRYLRDVVVTQNLVRNAGIGIAISATEGAGSCLVAQNMISGVEKGAILTMDHERIVSDELASGASGDPRITLSGNVVT